jgi:glutathione synthase/RimK-type ligase-like ATP-grasp enzyme
VISPRSAGRRPLQLCFATCATRPRITEDDALLAEAFDAVGVAVQARPWTAIEPLAGTVPILLRSTWDYHHQPARFAAWLSAMSAAGALLLNPAATVRGNMDKMYLRELEARGIPIPRTRWIDRPDRESIAATLDEEGWDLAVLKPRIGATSHGTLLVDRTAALSDDVLIPVRESGGLIQEFLPEIQEAGEFSLIYFDGSFSHAARKLPRRGEFRVQNDFGGTVEVAVPSREAMQLGHALLASVARPCPYARVDLVETRRGPLLMELELIEPVLFFGLAPAAAARLAQVVLPLLLAHSPV